jgi:cystathionine beta-lyase/cystathionine gamma-synthase
LTKNYYFLRPETRALFVELLTNPLLKAADIPALVERLLLKTNVISFAVSLGGVESIISYPARMSHAAMPRP